MSVNIIFTDGYVWNVKERTGLDGVIEGDGAFVCNQWKHASNCE